MNLQYKYYSEYYKKIHERTEDIKDINNKYTDKIFSVNQNDANCSVKILKESFGELKNSKYKYSDLMFKTTYPGLVIGGGYVHEVPDCDDAFKLGFSLDYVTGMPYIPSSSVKGVLRAAFSNGDYMNDILEIDELVKELDEEEVMKKKIKDAESNNKIINNDVVTYEDKEKYICDKIRDNIFGPDGDDSCQGADTFLDAIVVTDKTGKLKIFADDYITKHNRLKNPVPIKFLKVRPDVNFMFRFILCESEIGFKVKKNTHFKVKDDKNNIFTVTVKSETKRELFNRILLDFGIGARRNVGYGVLKKSNIQDNWHIVEYGGN